jgi:hypothetical protein
MRGRFRINFPAVCVLLILDLSEKTGLIANRINSPDCRLRCRADATCAASAAIVPEMMALKVSRKVCMSPLKYTKARASRGIVYDMRAWYTPYWSSSSSIELSVYRCQRKVWSEIPRLATAIRMIGSLFTGVALHPASPPCVRRDKAVQTAAPPPKIDFRNGEERIVCMRFRAMHYDVEDRDFKTIFSQ